MNSFSRANVFFCIILVCFVAGAFVMAALYQAVGIMPPYWLRSLLHYGLWFGLPILWGMRRLGYRASDVGFRRPKRPMLAIGAAFLTAFLIQPPLLLISALSELVFPNPVTAAMDQILADPLPLALLASALLPAFFEEWACRGVYLTECRSLGMWPAAALSGLVFGILHLNLQQLPYAFCFGTVAALLTWMSGSLWPAILMHLLINAAQVLMARYEIVLLGSWAELLPAALTGGLLSFLLLRALYKALVSDPA